jgi:hypothetical protein
VRRFLLILTVALVVVMAIAMPALAAPGFPGPNSVAPDFASTGENFGHCQSRIARTTDPANTAQYLNPALSTKGGGGGVAFSCPKE